jgi:hypothetical protein
MSIFLIILGLLVTLVVSVGIPTLLLSFGFGLTFLKALAVTVAIRIAAQT